MKMVEQITNGVISVPPEMGSVTQHILNTYYGANNKRYDKSLDSEDGDRSLALEHLVVSDQLQLDSKDRNATSERHHFSNEVMKLDQVLQTNCRLKSLSVSTLFA